MFVPFSCYLFWGLSLALRSHDEFKASDWSTLLHYQTLVLAAWSLPSCWSSCEVDCLFQGGAEGWLKWRRSGYPSLAFSCILRLLASQVISRFALLPMPCQLPEAGKSHIKVRRFQIQLYHTLLYLQNLKVHLWHFCPGFKIQSSHHRSNPTFGII